MRHRIGTLLALFAPLLLCGCLEFTDKLTINEDGSGSVQMEIVATLPVEMIETMSASMGMGAGMGEDEPTAFPPMQRRQALALFPARDFELTYKQTNSESGVTRVSIDAKFKNVNLLLQSRYAEAHGLSLKLDNGKLLLKTKTGLQSLAQLLTSDSHEGWLDSMTAFGGKPDTNGPVKYSFEAILPGAVAESNGTKSAGTAKWEFEKGKLDEKQFAEKLSETLSAAWPADKIKFKPQTPPRLALENFKDLGTEGIKAAGPVVDAEKVRAAVKFVPYSLRVTRTLDLAGEQRGGHENTAILTGAIVVPTDLAPQQWGETKLLEVKDSKGKSLLPEEDEDRQGSFSQSFSHVINNNDEEAEDESTPTSKDSKRIVTLQFQPPDWQVGEISVIKGAAKLLYFGGSQVVKLSNAVPEKSIMRMDQQENSFSFSDDDDKPIPSPKLAELGLKMKLSHAMQQGENLNLSFDVESKGTTIAAIQIYDADGKPLPTTFSKHDSGDSVSYSVSVTGKPKAPLSVALLAPDVSTPVEIPISLEKVPVRTTKK